MIRWHFVLTRLIVVVLILMLLRWGMGPVAGYITVRGIETATGARAEIGQTSVGLFPPRVQYTDVAIADPRDGKSLQNIFTAESIDLVIDGDELLHRRFVASDGRITGITVGSQRGSNGHFDAIDEEPVANSGPSMLSGLFGGLYDGATDKVEGAAEAFVDDLETIRRGKEIRDRWESDYETLLTQAGGLEKQIRSIRDRGRELMKGDELYNKLRDTSELPRLLEQAMAVREELVQVRQQIDSMPSRVQSDMVAMQQAKQIDMAKVDAYVPGNLADSKNFGVDLITGAIQGEIQRVRDYMDGGRAIANYTIVGPDSERVRGVDHDLRGNHHPPETLVRRCQIGGLMRASGNMYAMTGAMENLTPTPERLIEPTKVTFHLEGPDVVDVELVRDRRGGNDVDLLTVHWPEMQPKPMKLGNSDDVRLTVAGGSRELWVRLRQEGGQLTGRLISKQVGVNVGLDVDDSVAQTAMVGSLKRSLAGVDRIEIDSKFEGTWDDMDFQVTSNLGQVLHRAARDAVADQVTASKQQLAAKVNEQHLQQTQQLNEWLASHQGKANQLMVSADESIAEITNKIAEKTDRFADSIWNGIQGKLR